MNEERETWFNTFYANLIFIPVDNQVQGLATPSGVWGCVTCHDPGHECNTGQQWCSESELRPGPLSAQSHSIISIKQCAVLLLHTPHQTCEPCLIMFCTENFTRFEEAYYKDSIIDRHQKNLCLSTKPSPKAYTKNPTWRSLCTSVPLQVEITSITMIEVWEYRRFLKAEDAF